MSTAPVPAVGDLADLDTLFDVVPVPMWLAETATGRIVRANEAAARQYGWSATELATMSVLELASGGPPGDEVRTAEGSTSASMRHRRRDGSILHVNLASGPIIVNGTEMLVGVVCDISSYVRAAEQRDLMMRELIDEHELLRSGIADRLHDGPAQALTAVSLRLGLLRRGAAPDVQIKLAEVEQLVSSALVAVRAEMNDQRKPDDVAPDLRGAIDDLLARLGLTEHFVVRSVGGDPPPAIVRLLYRVIESVFASVRAGDDGAEPREILIEIDDHDARMTLPVGSDVGVDGHVWKLIEVIHGRIERLADAANSVVITVPVSP